MAAAGRASPSCWREGESRRSCSAVIDCRFGSRAKHDQPIRLPSQALELLWVTGRSGAAEDDRFRVQIREGLEGYVDVDILFGSEVLMEHAVIVHLKLDDDGFGSGEKRESINDLQDELADAIDEAEADEYDGDEFGEGEGEGVLFMYGPDADVLFGSIEQILKKSSHAKGGFAIKRYGEASDQKAREVKVRL